MGQSPKPQIYFETIDPYVIKLEKKTFLRKGMNKTFMQGKPS
jgi:hypothetical protein